MCGKVGADSKDHIPPKNIFLEKTSDLLTVPAHTECNKEYEKDDEYFLFFLSVAAFPKSREMRKLWKGKILRSLNRPESQKYKNYIDEHINSVDLLSKDGVIIGNRDVFYAEANRINNILSKTAKGIIFKEDETFITPSSHIEVQLMKPNVRELRGEDFSSIGNDIFQYAWHKKENIYYLWFIFYKCVDIWISVTLDKNNL